MARATVHIEDRGLQFADSVYEVLRGARWAPLDEEWHLERLERSLKEIAMPMPMGRGALSAVMRETVRRNRVKLGIVYLTSNPRRASPRSSDPATARCRRSSSPRAAWIRGRSASAETEGVGVITHARHSLGPLRHQVDGSVADGAGENRSAQSRLLRSLAHRRRRPRHRGRVDQYLDRDRDDVVVTRQLGNTSLAGVTRRAVWPHSRAPASMPSKNAAFTLEKPIAAREAFVTSAPEGASCRSSKSMSARSAMAGPDR